MSERGREETDRRKALSRDATNCPVTVSLHCLCVDTQSASLHILCSVICVQIVIGVNGNHTYFQWFGVKIRRHKMQVFSMEITRQNDWWQMRYRLEANAFVYRVSGGRRTGVWWQLTHCLLPSKVHPLRSDRHRGPRVAWDSGQPLQRPCHVRKQRKLDMQDKRKTI